jgi:dihydroorotate dehydrogenase
VIIGNLQGDRRHPAFDKEEINQVKQLKGNFSGKPTFDRSNELIGLAFSEFGKELLIVGCGGVFNAVDAYEKIRRGATLVQLITGMVYQGPQIAAEFKLGLVNLLKRDGARSLEEIRGSAIS